MTDWAKELLDSPPPAKQQEPSVDWAREITESPSIGPARPEAPAFVQDQYRKERMPTEGAASFGTAWKASFADSPDKIIGIYAKARYPNLPEAAARGMYSVRDGELFYVDPDGVERPEHPDGMPEKLKTALAGMTGGYLPHAVLGTAGEIVAGPAGAMAGAAAGEAVRKGVGAVAFGEDITAGDALDVAKEGAFGLGGSLVARGLTGGVNRAMRAGDGPVGKLAARDYGRIDWPESRALEAKGRRFGVPLKAPEVANSAELLNAVKQLRGMPDSATQFDDWIRGTRMPQIEQAVGDYLDTLSSEKSILKANEKGAGAARTAIGVRAPDGSWTGLKGVREKAAEPYYSKAMKSEADVDLKPVLDYLDEELATAKGDMARTLEKVRKAFVFPGSDEYDVSLSGLHGTKLELDSMLDRFGGESSLSRVEKSKVAKVKDLLLQSMDDASPDYRQARKIYEVKSKDIAAAEDTLAGKIAGDAFQGDAALKASRVIFDSNVSSPEAVKAARGIIEFQDPEAWGALARANLQEKWERLAEKVATGDVKNIGGIWKNQVLGTKQQRSIWEEALRPDQYQALIDFGDVLEASGRMLRGGSDTAMNMAGIQAMKEEGRGVLPAMVRGTNPFNLPDMLARQIESRNLRRYSQRIMGALLSEDGVQAVRQIKQLPPGSKKQAEALGVFLSLEGVRIPDSRAVAGSSTNVERPSREADRGNQ